MEAKYDGGRGFTYAMRPLYGFIHEPRSVTSDVQAIVPLERAERLLKIMGQSVSCSVDVGIITDQSTMCIDEWRGGGWRQSFWLVFDWSLKVCLHNTPQMWLSPTCIAKFCTVLACTEHVALDRSSWSLVVFFLLLFLDFFLTVYRFRRLAGRSSG